MSRAYYAAHVALAKELIANGYVPPIGRQTQRHRDQSVLIRRYLKALKPATQKRLVATFVRLYARRIDADYKRTVMIDRTIALDSVRDAAAAMRTLKTSQQ